MKYTKELELAKTAAVAAGKIQTEHSRSTYKIDIKEDNSPVTEVDKICEKLIKNKILAVFPEDSFLGEESGLINKSSGRQWIVDPLDGTRPYIHGIPTYSVMIALVENGKPVMGVIFFPALDELYYSSEGSGAYCNGIKLTTSNTDTIKHSMGSALGIVEKHETTNGINVLKLLGKCDYAYGFMDAYSYVSVAAGRLDFCISLIDKPWDRAAAVAILIEAGGNYSNFSELTTFEDENFIISNGSKLHGKILSELSR